MEDEILVPAPGNADEIISPAPSPKDQAQRSANFGLGLQASMQAGVFGPLGQFLTRKVGEPKEPTRTGSGVADAWQAGVESSSMGLLMRGQLPSVTLDPHHSKWYERLAQMAGTVYGDIPAMIVGGASAAVAGIPSGPGAVVAGGAGAFAAPAAVREALMQAYTIHEVGSASEFLNRTAISVANTGKAAVTGGLTALTGNAVASYAGRGFGASLKVGAAETAAMTTAPALMDLRLPEPQEFLDAAVMVVGMQAIGAAPTAAARLRETYARTGKTPAEVVADMQADPTIKRDLMAEDGPTVPGAYKELEAQHAGMEAVPGLAEAVGSELMLPRAEVPGEPQPTHVNYRYINAPEHVQAALARMSELNLDHIQKQRRGTVSWEQTQHEAGLVLADLLGSPADMLAPRQPGTPAGAAELLARKQILEGAANDISVQARQLMELGTNASPEQVASFLASIDRAAMIQAEFLGARAEAGRALNILKETKTSAERAAQINELIARFKDDPAKLASMIAELNDPKNVLAAAKAATKSTLWQQIKEGYAAFLVSAPPTQVANTMSNLGMLLYQPFVDLGAAAGGALFQQKNPVHFSEVGFRAAWNIKAVPEALKLAWLALKEGSAEAQMEHQTHIPGTAGKVIRTASFGPLEAMDVLFRHLNEQGQAAALGARQASKTETFGTREFYEAVARFVDNPPPKALDEIEAFGKRMTFKDPLGDVGKKFRAWVSSSKVAWILFPFIQTPANVFKQMGRMSIAAPMVGAWREDVAAGGARAARAYSEMVVGSSIAGWAMKFAFDGQISGGGDPDPNKRRVKEASGWQPYSIKVGDKWYSYKRIQPFGAIIGMAADIADAWEHKSPDERDRALHILGMAFANGVTNQTFLQGITQFGDAMSQPDRKMGRFLQNLVAGATVPSVVSWMATNVDPYQREVDSILDAVKNRIPGLRQTLQPRIDPYGNPVPELHMMGFMGPKVSVAEKTDKVYTEAARLELGVAKAPKSLELPAAGVKEVGKVELTPEQRTMFATEAGKAAYDNLKILVHSPGWDNIPDPWQKQAMEDVFHMTRQWGEYHALPLEQREKEIQRILKELDAKMKAPHKPSK